MTAAQLAGAVQTRRTQLGLRQTDLEIHGGPSLGTVQNIEQVTRTVYAAHTFATLDQALQWRPGSARGCFHHGLDPTPADAAPSKPVSGEDARALRIGHLVIALAGEMAEELQRPG